MSDFERTKLSEFTGRPLNAKLGDNDIVYFMRGNKTIGQCALADLFDQYGNRFDDYDHPRIAIKHK